jgi:hypothetical protein
MIAVCSVENNVYISYGMSTALFILLLNQQNGIMEK